MKEYSGVTVSTDDGKMTELHVRGCIVIRNSDFEFFDTEEGGDKFSFKDNWLVTLNTEEFDRTLRSLRTM